MRLVGKLESEKRAQTFGDYLYLQEIESSVEEGSDGQWEIWVLDDDHLARAEELFAAYRESGNRAQFEGSEKKPARIRRRASRVQKAGQKDVVEGHHLWSYSEGSYPIGYLTAILIAVSVGFYLLSMMRGEGRWPAVLFIEGFELIDGIRFWNEGLQEIRRGQVWRLVTPIFIHFTLLHIVFNMMWLMDLGSTIEYNKGTRFFAFLVLLVAASSNLGQYLVSGPSFGGMSGVVYGLLGYAWMMGRYDPGSGMRLRKATVTMMLLWFVLCVVFSRVMPIANTAHAIGLALGVVWGFCESGGIGRTSRRLGW